MINWIVNIIGSNNAYEVFSFILTFFFYIFAMCAFMFARNKRKYFYLKLTASIIIGLAVSFGLAMLNTTATNTVFVIPVRIICYLLLSSYIFLVMVLCYDENTANISLIWCCTICTQSIAGKSYALIQNIVGINDTATISLVHSDLGQLQNWEFIPYLLINIAIIFLLAFLFRKPNNLSRDKVINKKVALLSISFTIVMHGIVYVARLYEKESVELSIILKLFAIIFCFLIIFLATGIFEQSKKEQDYIVVKELLHQEKTRIENVKSNMEVINTKIHDLKKIIDKVEDKLNKQDTESLKRALQFYDSNIQTGNDILDIVLCEKSIICQQLNIKFTCLANAKNLNMLTQTQIYSVFGNIMDNAIRASKKLPEEKRFISLTVREDNDKIIIEETNFFTGQIHLNDNNDIETSKIEKSKHGFGIKSINYIITEHQGNLGFQIEKDRFTIIITIPHK